LVEWYWQGKTEYEAMVEWYWQGRTEYVAMVEWYWQGKTVWSAGGTTLTGETKAMCPQQIWHNLLWYRNLTK
jgi:hypothetical protein